MATLTKAINKNLFDSILPSFGNPRVHIPVWDDSQKMFICDEFESNGGHRYYRGIRFCDRIVILEKVGLYHSWTYIQRAEDGTHPEARLRQGIPQRGVYPPGV